MQKPGVGIGLVGVIGDFLDQVVVTTDVQDVQAYDGLGRARLEHPSVHIRNRVGVELTRQLHPPLCALAVAGDRLNLTLY